MYCFTDLLAFLDSMVVNRWQLTFILQCLVCLVRKRQCPLERNNFKIAIIGDPKDLP